MQWVTCLHSITWSSSSVIVMTRACEGVSFPSTEDYMDGCTEARKRMVGIPTWLRNDFDDRSRHRGANRAENQGVCLLSHGRRSSGVACFVLHGDLHNTRHSVHLCNPKSIARLYLGCRDSFGVASKAIHSIANMCLLAVFWHPPQPYSTGSTSNLCISSNVDILI